MEEASLRNYATEAIRYWEPRRLLYNGLLAVVVALTFWLNLPASKASITIDSVLWLFLLAVLANVAYCAAYIVDILVQVRVPLTMATVPMVAIRGGRQLRSSACSLLIDGSVCRCGGWREIALFNCHPRT